MQAARYPVGFPKWFASFINLPFVSDNPSSIIRICARPGLSRYHPCYAPSPSVRTLSSRPVTSATSLQHSNDYPDTIHDDVILAGKNELAGTKISSSGVTIINNHKEAHRVVSQLMQISPENPVAWDTETTGVNPIKESPVHNGRVICATAYAGDHIDFGSGPRLFIDCLDGEQSLLDVFKPYFEDRTSLKVWHHYGFDRHVLENHGIVPRGFAGDTMHMARLLNTTHTRFSLEELSKIYLDVPKHSMMNLFGAPERLRDGSDGKKIVIPPTIQLQREAQTRPYWIHYATTDAELTHRLYHMFKTQLGAMDIKGVNSTPSLQRRFPDLLTLYREILIPFGELLTEMERTGFKVDVAFLQQAERQADSDRQKLLDKFLNWAVKHSPNARYMNINSAQQKLQLFFAPCSNVRDRSKVLPASKTFSVELSGVQRELYLEELKGSDSDEDHKKYEKIIGGSRRATRDITIEGLGKECRGHTMTGWPSTSSDAMRKLAGSPRDDPPKFGDSDKELCFAVDDMIAATSISTLMSTFIVPLQNWPGKDERIHASLNLNTETGRLSSRRPNLQNQPALDKDRYKVRKAFICEEGNSLIVADYGQLELRLLAHITRCQSMIQAFKAGGDFHSRTAMTMFDHVKEAVQAGQCALERDARQAESRVPLLKDMFSVERRKAKTLNFSIAYGKTVMGFARDWNVTDDEARETLALWYKERQEVKLWQDHCKQFLRKHGFVETLFGRRRHIPDVNNMRKIGHANRAAINAPLQGSAADLVMAAMIGLHRDSVLRDLGWKIVLQVHDEIILEGPTATASTALPLIVHIMKNPIDAKLLVDLTVDAKISRTWYDAK